MQEQEITIAQYSTGTLFPVVNSCKNAHHHGQTVLELRWYYSEPTTIFVRAGEVGPNGEPEQEFVMGRDLLLEALRAGTSAGFPIVGEGNVMCQVLRDNRMAIVISFNGGYVVIADRDALTEWLMGTYKHVPQDRECTVLDMDRVIAELLSKK